MRIGIFQDVHANLPAFKKALEIFENHKCQALYHVGDLIGIGPQPKEVLELAISIKPLTFIMGNHDYWYAYGLPDPQSHPMSEEEVDHQEWTHAEIGPTSQEAVQSWNFFEEIEIGRGRRITFVHYGYDRNTNWFKDFIREPTAEDMDNIFTEFESEIVFYGHNHEPSDIDGKSRYINLGSAGCHNKAEVRLGILETIQDQVHLKKFSVPYDDDGLLAEYEKRKVPARSFIKKNFISRNNFRLNKP